MTVFCILYSDVTSGEQPILISDVLITKGTRSSQEGRRYEKLYLPSIGGRFPDLPNKISIDGYIQKMYVTDKYTFVVAGGYAAVENFHLKILSSETIEEFVSVCGPVPGMLICSPS
jgi:hypothetical protein